MKAFNGIDNNGQTVEITHNDNNTHFYCNNRRIKSSLAIEMKERFESARLTIASKKDVEVTMDTAKEGSSDETAIVFTGSTEELLKLVSETSSIKEKMTLLKSNLTDELKLLLGWSRKSELSKGFSWKRISKFLDKCKSNEDCSSKLDRSDECNPEIINSLVSDGKPRFELKDEEKIAVINSIPQGKEELYCNAISKNLKLGLSDKQINSLL